MKTRKFNYLGDIGLDVFKLRHLLSPAKRLPPIYLFVAVDHASRWAYGELHQSRSALTAIEFLENLARQAPFRIQTVSTDYDRSFKGPCVHGRGTIQDASETFNQACSRLGIVHRSTPPWKAVDASGVERFQCRIGKVLETAGGVSLKDFAPTLRRCLEQYNNRIPHPALGQITPMQAVRRGLAGSIKVGKQPS